MVEFRNGIRLQLYYRLGLANPNMDKIKFGRMATQGIAVLAIAVLVIGTAQVAYAETRLRTQLKDSSGAVSGAADFRDLGARKRLSVQIEDQAANTMFSVNINGGSSIGSITTDAFGVGTLHLETQNGDTVPAIVSGNKLNVVDALGNTVLSGQF